MLDKEKHFEKVVLFYRSLPDDLLQEIINALPVNRKTRRDINKQKTSKSKIEMIMSTGLRKVFVDTAYVTIKSHVSLELEKASYDEIINYITDDNKIYVTIFFFRWCYEERNDDVYFDTFVDSEIFAHILNGENIEGISPVAEKREPTLEIDTNTFTGKTSDDEEDGEVDTMKLLGRIEKRNTFYNFFPQYEL